MRSLPRELADAIAAAELVVGGLLLAFPRTDPTELGLGEFDGSVPGTVPVGVPPSPFGTLTTGIEPFVGVHEPTLDAPTAIPQSHTQAQTFHDAACPTVISTATSSTRTSRKRESKERGVTTGEHATIRGGSTKDGSRRDELPESCDALQSGNDEPKMTSERADGSRVPGIQTDGDPLNEIHEIHSVANPEKSVERADDSVILGLSEFRRDGGRVLSDGVVPTFHAVSSSNSSIFRVEDGSKSRDESRERYEGISNSSIKGAVWKIARSKAEAAIVQNSPMDPLRSTSLNVQKSLTDTVLLNPVQKSSINDVSVPKIAMTATTAPSPLCSRRFFLVLYRTLVKDGALPSGYDREFRSLEPVVRAAARRENEKAITSKSRKTIALFTLFNPGMRLVACSCDVLKVGKVQDVM